MSTGAIDRIRVEMDMYPPGLIDGIMSFKSSTRYLADKYDVVYTDLENGYHQVILNLN
jgi:hypothetical protein